jgi:hypothetical protein
MAPINDTILGGASIVIGTLNPHVSMVVVMNVSSMSTLVGNDPFSTNACNNILVAGDKIRLKNF